MINNTIKSYVMVMGKVNKNMELAVEKNDYTFLLKMASALKETTEKLESLLEQELSDRFTA
jgi:hypothetical protein